MKFRMPFQGVARAGRSYASIAQKRRDGLQTATEIAHSMSKDEAVISLWDLGDLEEIRVLCKDRELHHGDPHFVSGSTIWTLLSTLLRNTP